MNVYLFGKNDSPCIANYALGKYAQDSSESKAETLFAVENEFYMDDFLRSDNSLSNLYEVCHIVTTVLQKCSFRLRKWITSDQKLLERFEPSERLLKKGSAI